MRAGLALCLVAGLAAADPPAVPDPYGLGERLALIDLLQERYHLRLPGEPGLAALRQAYREAWLAAQGPAPAAETADADVADRAARLRILIARRHGTDAPSGLDEAGLLALLHRLDAEKAQRDAAAIAAMQAADAARPREPEAAEPAAATPAAHGTAPTAPAVAPAATAAPVAANGIKLRDLPFAASGVTGCVLAQDGALSAVLVMFGSDPNGAFRGLPGAMLAALHGAPGIRRAVLLLGHGTGSSIGGEPIEAHLQANRAFYESQGGSAPAQPIDCLVFASCAAGNPNQMLSMREGLGYYPTWRVATGNRTYANGLVVFAALRAVAARPASPAWRGLFRWSSSEGEASCFGEVGAGGERAETEFFNIVPAGDSWKVEKR